MAVSVGSAARGPGAKLAVPGAVFPGELAGGWDGAAVGVRTRKSRCDGVAGGEAPSPRPSVSRRRGGLAAPRLVPGAAAGGLPAPPPARPRLGRRPRVRWQEDGAGRVPGTGAPRREAL